MSRAVDIEQALQPVVAARGYELVDLEYRREPRGWTLRLYIDKPGGVTIDDCQAVSEMASFHLDATDIISAGYLLEVSSPGLDRKLKNTRDFERFMGAAVTVTTFLALEGQLHFTGVLSSADDERIVVDDATSGMRTIPRSAIAGARLRGETAVGKSRHTSGK